MRHFIFRLTLKDYPFILCPWAHNKQFHVQPNYEFTFGFGLMIGKNTLRQGIAIITPLYRFNFYFHSLKKSEEIFNKNNPAF